MSGWFPNGAYLVCAAAIMACSNDSAVDPSIPSSAIKPASTLTTLRVLPDMLAIQLGSTQQLSVSALDQSGVPLDVSSNLTYKSDSPGIAQVNDQGIVTGLAPGVVRISAVVKVGVNATIATATAYVRDSVAFPDVVLRYDREGWNPYDAAATASSIVQWQFDPATSATSAARIYLRNAAGIVIDSVVMRGSPGFHQFTTPGTYSYCMNPCSTLQSGKLTVR